MHLRLDQIIDGLKQAKSLDDLNTSIAALRDALGIDHLVYHSVNNLGQQWAALTYDPTWVTRYIAEDYARIDPVVQGSLRNFNPFDWRKLDWGGKNVRNLLGEARDMGVGEQGFSIPIRGPNGQFAVLTVNDQRSDDAWTDFTHKQSNDLLLIAHYINQRALVIEQADGPPREAFQNLSPREIDALSFMAMGFSRMQAADKLRISEHTLRVYIESARAKLGALNTTHAVARALTLGLLAL
ncbi:MAG: LuxR family transcriptional regulator [Deltaproteobacteria bacterium]